MPSPRHLLSWPRWLVAAALFGAASAAAALDLLAVPEISLTILHLPLVVAAARRVGLVPALLLAAVGGVSHYAAATAGGLSGLTAASGALSWWVVLTAVGWMASRTALWEASAKASDHIDPLTGLLNRRGLFERAEGELNRSRRTGRPLSIAFIDCDDFKPINDTRGHRAGDDLLASIAAALQSSTRSYDITGRLGGDEFVVIFPETGAEDALPVVERLRDAMLRAARRTAPSLTLSIGVVTFVEAPPAVEDLIHAADVQMYVVKRGGKDGIRSTVVGAAALAD